VDEADSVLIDEAVTPLLISGDGGGADDLDDFRKAADIAAELRQPFDYRVNHRYREVSLTDRGRARQVELWRDRGGASVSRRRAEELVVQALNARELYGQGKQYVVQDSKVVIVDEFTGRLMPDRTWRGGLHQAVEAKEALEITPPKETFARISFQRFFRRYGKLSGTSGTAVEATGELWQIYRLPVVVIPTNRPCIRKMLPDRVFATADEKWAAVVEEIGMIHQTGRPLLVGTRSVEASERLSGLLKDRNLDHEVLNAVRHAEEAKIVAGAGGAGRITVATNMAGRGTDIMLGRNVADLGGLHVMATERHEARRVDRQLFGRAARQGDPGSGQAFVSLEDELISRYSPHLGALLRRRRWAKSGEISCWSARKLFDRAQSLAESAAFRQRKEVLRTDDWLDDYLSFAGKETK
jgi:preprotein translocase subunit SecA